MTDTRPSGLVAGGGWRAVASPKFLAVGKLSENILVRKFSDGNFCQKCKLLGSKPHFGGNSGKNWNVESSHNF